MDKRDCPYRPYVYTQPSTRVVYLALHSKLNLPHVIIISHKSFSNLTENRPADPQLANSVYTTHHMYNRTTPSSLICAAGPICTLSLLYCTFIMYPAIRLSSRKCAINSVFRGHSPLGQQLQRTRHTRL